MRTSPHDLGAERAFLGGLIRGGAMTIEDARDAVRPDEMYRPDHAALYTLLLTMADLGRTVDLVSVATEVSRGGQDEMYGGLTYVLGLQDECPSTAGIWHYAEAIRAKAGHRRLLAAIQEIEAAAYAESDPPDVLAARLIASLDIAADVSGADEWTDLDPHLDDVLLAADAMSKGERPASMGADMPWPAMAELMPTLPRGELVVVGARPAMGKTALGMSLAEAIARKGGCVGIYSLEVPADRLARGTLTRAAREVEDAAPGADGITMRAIEHGELSERRWDVILQARDRLRGLPIAISRRSDATPADIAAGIRKLKRRADARGKSLDLVVVDYLGLLQMGTERDGNLPARIAAATRTLKVAARATNTTILLLCQLNRQCEQRADKRPEMSDLRDSGGIEQDAAVVWMLYRDVVYNDEAPPTEAEILVRKNRFGRIGSVEMVFDGPGTRWMDPSETADELSRRIAGG